MQCFVYKGLKKADHYLYLPTELTAAVEDKIPDAIRSLLGELAFVVELQLDETRKLAQADAKQVMDDIQTQGFYLQMPKRDMLAEEAAYFN